MWSVGCIFAEMLGRKVFLAGGSGLEQLHLILQRLGTPPDEVISRIPSAKAIAYLQRLPRYEAKPLGQRFPEASSEALDLLHRMLQFEPGARISVEEALGHPFLASLHDPASEPAYPLLDFSFDRRLQTLSELKTAIAEEVALYRAMLLPPSPASPYLLAMQSAGGGKLQEPFSGGDDAVGERDPMLFNPK